MTESECLRNHFDALVDQCQTIEMERNSSTTQKHSNFHTSNSTPNMPLDRGVFFLMARVNGVLLGQLLINQIRKDF